MHFDKVWLNFHKQLLSKQVLRKKCVINSIIYILLYSIKKHTYQVTNFLTHTKQVAFHGPEATEVYAVGFDVFAFSPRPRRVF